MRFMFLSTNILKGLIMEYKISGQIEIDSSIDIDIPITGEMKEKFKKDIEKAFVNAFDNVCDIYKMSEESVHSVFVDWIDIETESELNIV